MIHIELNQMAETLTAIDQKLQALGERIEDPQRYKANFVCEEVLTNLSRYADFEDKPPNVTLTLNVSDEKELLMIFKDNSQPFNLLDFPDPKLGGELEEAKLGGLGIFLTKQYAKEITYRYEDFYNILAITL